MSNPKKSKYPPKAPNQHIVKIPPKLNWSEYQKAIFRDIYKGTGHTAVVAFAGCSKTSSIIEGFKYVPKGLNTLMVAFNKSIADELKQRAPSYVFCSTLHSLGLMGIKARFGEIVIDNDKSRNIVETIIGNSKDKWDLNQNLCKCISLCKAHLYDSPSKIKEIIEDFDIELCDIEINAFVRYVVKALSIAKSQTNIIDFDDMIWFPFIYNIDLGKWDRIFVDESQDLNQAQMAMILSGIKPDGRITILGDPKQALYGFRGADSDAMYILIKKLNAKILTLPITYRCPKKIVELAQEIVPGFMYADSAPDGKITNINTSELLKHIKPGDFVLSRTNAPLVKHCMAAIKAGIPCNIKGRDIGSNFLYFIKKSKAKTINEFISHVNKWQKQEIERLTEERKKTDYVTDKAECLLNLCDGLISLDDLKKSIEEMFIDVSEKDKVVFSSTHKIKGLEADRVFVLSETYRYSPGCDDEEANIWYVAISRAKKELFIVCPTNQYNKYDDKKQDLYEDI